MLDALKALQRDVPDLERLIAAGNVKDVVDAVQAAGIPQSLMSALTDATATAAVGGFEAAGFELGFNQPNQQAIRWAQANAGKEITGVSTATKQIVQEIVQEAVTRGIHPRVAARQIQRVVPLLPQHQQAVTRLFNSSIDAGVTVAHAEKVAARKSRKLLRYRAEMIARTESIRASNMGQQLLWEQAEALNLIPAGTKKIWVATGDDRTCKICAPLDGKVVAVTGGEFKINRQATSFTRSGSTFTVAGTKPYRGWGPQPTPPAHPMCRCTVILETIEAPGEQRRVAEPEWKPMMSEDEAIRFAADSKIEGPVMHGTSVSNARGITAEGFEPDRVAQGHWFGEGTYFTKDAEAAQRWGQWMDGEPAMVTSRVKVTNPYVMEDWDVLPKDIADYLRTPDAPANSTIDRFLFNNEEIEDIIESANRRHVTIPEGYGQSTAPAQRSFEWGRQFTEELRSRGHDGVVIRSRQGRGAFQGILVGGEEVLVFDPKQIATYAVT